MKKNISQKFALVVLLLLLSSSGLYAQREFNTHKSGGIWRHWFVKASVGGNAYFGDISTYDHDPFNKLQHETKFGYSASVGKWVTEWGGASFTFSGGKMKGIRNNTESNTDFFQYTVEGMVNITQLIYDHDMQSNFYFFATIGYGLIEFNALHTNQNGDTLNMVGKNSAFGKRVTEWVIPLGFGGVYNIDKNFGLFFNATYNYTNTDKLDARYDGSDPDANNDYYVYLSGGLKYTFTIKEKYGNYHRPVSRRKIRWVR